MNPSNFLTVQDSFPFTDDFYQNHLLVSPEGIALIHQMTSNPIPVLKTDKYGFCSGHFGDHKFYAHKHLGPDSSSAFAAASTVVGQLTTPSPIMPKPYLNMFGGVFQFWIKGSKLGYRMLLFLACHPNRKPPDEPDDIEFYYSSENASQQYFVDVLSRLV